jgi:sarcosine oxidase subunit beta
VTESVDLFLDFEEQTHQSSYDLDIRQQGYLWLTTDTRRAERQRRLVEMQHSWGQTDVELLDGEEIRARWPYVTPDVIQGRFRAGDGFLDPKQLTLGLAAASRAPVVTDCGVTGFATSGDRITGVHTTQGTIDTQAAVIAAGPLSPLVAKTAGVTLPVTTVPRHKVVMPHVPAVPHGAPMTIDDDTGAHWRPVWQGAALLFTDPTTAPTDPVEDVPPDHRVARRLLDPKSEVAVARIAPFWQEVWSHGAAHWLVQSGQYTMTPDHRPLLGPTELDGLYVNSGYSGHGIMGSPAGSRHFIDVLTGRIAPEENLFALDRTFTERDLDVL